MEPPGRQRSRRGAIVLVGVAITAAILTAGLTSSSGDAVSLPVQAEATSSTTPTTTAAPVDELAAVGAETATIATAAVPHLEVFEQIPHGASTTPHQLLSTAANWATYTPDRVGSPEIPTMNHPVVGRYRTETGWNFSSPDGYGFNATFAVVERSGEWLHVLLPVRPNGTQGWVRASDVSLSTTTYRIEVNVSTRTVRLLDAGREVLSGQTIVGKAASPTPTGRFFVTDTIDKHVGSAYGPGILAISGFSQVLDHFADGVPVLALHGTNRPDLLGTAASNGCVRMGDETINALRSTVPLGTPVDIVP